MVEDLRACICCFSAPKGAPVKCEMAHPIKLEAPSREQDGPHGVKISNSVIIGTECRHKQRCEYQKDVVISINVKGENDG